MRLTKSPYRSRPNSPSQSGSSKGLHDGDLADLGRSSSNGGKKENFTTSFRQLAEQFVQKIKTGSNSAVYPMAGQREKLEVYLLNFLLLC